MNVISAHGPHMTGAPLKFISGKNILTWYLFSVLNVTAILGKSGTIHYIYYKVIILFTNGIRQTLMMLENAFIKSDIKKVKFC